MEFKGFKWFYRIIQITFEITFEITLERIIEIISKDILQIIFVNI